MADEVQDIDKTNDMESQIKSAIISRSSYFQDQADSLTFEKVRRLLEKDLGLETHALDAHKRFVKQWLHTCIESAASDDLSKGKVDAGENAVLSTEEAEPVDELHVKDEAEDPNSGDAEAMEDSPVMGLMTGSKKADGAEDTESKAVPNEIAIKKAIWDRASYLKENSESITLAGLRRLLEEDLELEKHTLDPFKKFISQQVDEVLSSPDIPEPIVSEKKKNVKKNSYKKSSSKSSKEETPASSGNESDEVEEEVKVRKRSASKSKPQKAEAVKKRKRTEEETKGAKRKPSKIAKSTSEGSGEEDGNEGNNSDSSAEKHVKKKEIPKPSYGKQVERLKSVIKSCGMSISPAVYKKVKQAPENKREACLIKELEEMLAKEGLSTNPSEKEIKDVKKRKERTKELEGIDLSNIVSSSRRRSTASFIPLPKPTIPDLSESESEESENEDDDEDVEEEGDEEVENEEADEDQENGGNSSQSEESDKGNSDSD